MSGGIDSTVTALMLNDEGYEVVGITLPRFVSSRTVLHNIGEWFVVTRTKAEGKWFW